jgi:hypothetical protein
LKSSRRKGKGYRRPEARERGIIRETTSWRYCVTTYDNEKYDF